MVWRIGNGSSVRIKEDRWLPVSTNRIVISPLSTLEPGARVNSLINTETGKWKLSEVQQLFLPHKATIIYGIPLSIRLPPDCVIWGLTPSSMFTTKSAYKMLISCDSTNNAGSSSLVRQKCFWRSLWQM